MPQATQQHDQAQDEESQQGENLLLLFSAFAFAFILFGMMLMMPGDIAQHQENGGQRDQRERDDRRDIALETEMWRARQLAHSA